ncbi:unnamed protein product [Linum tenue]|uniref:RING-type domain-containing protein n=1 Tax=Linum tenue TaxID=586396 RepID=A0AAV0KWM2_9ROSI|nr:unnamed protein product [Linum tenue]
MSAVDSGRESLAGLTLDAVLGNNKRSAPGQVNAATAAHMNKTLLDIIRDEDPHRSLFGHKDKKSWKAFRERLRLRRAGAAWTSSIQIPTSDLPIQKTNYGNAPRSMMSRRNSVRFTTMSNSDTVDDHPPESKPQMSRRSSNRYGSAMTSSHTDGEEFAVDTPAVGDEIPARSFRPQMSRRNSVRTSTPGMHDEEEEAAHHGNRRVGGSLVEERVLSAREAITAQEAAEAAAAQEAASADHIGVAEAEEEEEEFNDVGDGEGEGEGGMGMSLMDLLEETDREMGFEGARYVVGEDNEQTYYEDDDEDEGGGVVGGTEHTCCVCMVRHKGSAFIPCGHTFCRLCSRELWVQRGNCPLCNGFILEILDIF